MNIIDFCRETCKPQKTALYAVGGFLSGRCMGTISPMDGAVYMIAIRMAYLISQKFNNEACNYFNDKILNFREQISRNTLQTNSKPESNSLDRLKNSSLHLACSWTGLVQDKLLLLKQPMNFIDVYLSYAAGNGILYLLGKQPVGLLVATGIFFSSTVFAVLAGSSIDLAKDKKPNA